MFPKQLQQFEAVAIASGPDGKPGTPDDLQLGTVPVKWSLEEYTATFGDDDLKFVGTLDQTGLFTPNVDGPNPKRSGNRNNIGDVWVVAELTPDGAGAAAARPGAPPGDGAGLHALVQRGGNQMSMLAVREHHRFEAAGRPFVYLVPSAAIFALDETADDVMRTLGAAPAHATSWSPS